jgi:UDP-N-acetylglucosamine 4,6-dehydratase
MRKRLAAPAYAKIRYFLGDVRDRDRLQRAFDGVDVVIHAAALKQVPALEYNPLEAVKTNISGTQNVIDAALDANVEKVLLISSDKAVQPINLYGATKLCAEKICIAGNSYRGKARKTKFSVVRYGNVIGSRGSIIELIESQRKSGVITLTDPLMTRFWIHIDEVIETVIQGIRVMEGEEIFIPKMKSLKVADVFAALAPGCRVKTIGMRPGEKLHETLMTGYEMKRARDLGAMYAILPEFPATRKQSAHAKRPSLPAGLSYESSDARFLLPAHQAAKMLKYE